MVMVVAATGAFTTNAMNLKAEKSALEPGFIQPDNPEEECEISTTCTSENTGVDCTVDYNPAGEKLYHLEGNECTQKLYRPVD